MSTTPGQIQAPHGEVEEKPTYEEKQAIKENPAYKDDTDINHAERVLSADMDKKDHMDYDRVDKEVAQYSSDVKIDISEEENDRLRRMIDKRVLVIMIFTYFLQALDKGTLSFSSIMGIQKDTNLQGQQVRPEIHENFQSIPG
jgi:hypothetical protein